MGGVKHSLTLFMYSERRSWRAWRIALHSVIMRSRWISRVQEESANKAAPLIIPSKRFSSDGLILSSFTVRGSKTTRFYRERLKGGNKKSTHAHIGLLEHIAGVHISYPQCNHPTVWILINVISEGHQEIQSKVVHFYSSCEKILSIGYITIHANRWLQNVHRQKTRADQLLYYCLCAG